VNINQRQNAMVGRPFRAHSVCFQFDAGKKKGAVIVSQRRPRMVFVIVDGCVAFVGG